MSLQSESAGEDSPTPSRERKDYNLRSNRMIEVYGQKVSTSGTSIPTEEVTMITTEFKEPSPPVIQSKGIFNLGLTRDTPVHTIKCRSHSVDDLRWEVEAREQSLVMAALSAQMAVNPDNLQGIPRNTKIIWYSPGPTFITHTPRILISKFTR